MVKNTPADAGDIRDLGSIPGSEIPQDNEMATHSSILAWRISWTEEPGGLQSIGSESWTWLTLHIRRASWVNVNPNVFCNHLEFLGWVAWWAAVYGVSQSRTRLKWLSSSSRVLMLPLTCINWEKLKKHKDFDLRFDASQGLTYSFWDFIFAVFIWPAYDCK